MSHVAEPSIPAFTTELFKLEDHIQHDSDGWGMGYGAWLAKHLKQYGYNFDTVQPDTSGWRMENKQDGFSLEVACMLMEARYAKNFAELGLKEKAYIWVTAVRSKKPFLKSLFGSVDTKSAEQKLVQSITSALNSEPALNLFAEPEFDFDE
jgi:hypothetical protein